MPSVLPGNLRNFTYGGILFLSNNIFRLRVNDQSGNIDLMIFVLHLKLVNGARQKWQADCGHEFWLDRDNHVATCEIGGFSED